MKKEKKDCEQKFYLCTVCGNIIVKLNDSGIIPQCCSRTMVEITPDDYDAVIEKHVPDWCIEDGKLRVQIGSEEHPMEEEHHIEWIFVKTNKGFHVKFLSSHDKPEACFKLCEGEIITYIYEHCNIHGLWKTCCIDDESKCEMSDS